MNNNNTGISIFSIAGLVIPFLTLFLIRVLGNMVIVVPITGLILSIIGIIDARKNEKGGVIISILGINLSIVMIVVVVTIASMLAKAQRYG